MSDRIHDGCGWCPDANRPSISTDEHHLNSPAEIALGYRGRWRLCSKCADLPRFNRSKKRIQITRIDDEEWREISAWRGFYEVSSLGRVRSLFQNGYKVLRPEHDKHGRPRVRLYRGPRDRKMTVARLSAEKWHGPCPGGLEVSHIDGNEKNNTPANLVWESHIDNCARRDEHGTTLRGSVHPNSIIDDPTAVKVHMMLARGVGPTAVAVALGISVHVAMDISRGKTWTHVKMEIEP